MSHQIPYQYIKDKKEAILGSQGGDLTLGLYPYPHPLQTVSLAGSYTMVDDQREYSNAEEAEFRRVDEYIFNCSNAAVFARNNFEAYPGWVDGPPTDELAQNEFCLAHNPKIPWKVRQYFGYGSGVYMGNVVFNQYYYSSESTGPPWTLENETTQNELFRWTVGFSNGGHVYSGGKTQPGNVDAENMIIFVSIEPFPISSIKKQIKRFPWDRAWSDEAGIMDAALSAWIANGNAAHGGGFSGSTDMRVVFGV